MEEELCDYRGDIIKQLRDFPHLFHLERKGSESFKQRKLQTLRQRLESEDAPDYGEYSACAKHRQQTALSYVCFLLGDMESAMDCIDAVLAERPTYIPALSNKARYHLENEDFQESFQCLEQIKEFTSCGSNGRQASAEGYAELAYLYSRLSFQHYRQAAECYRHALCHVSDQLLWKYELGKVLMRLMTNCFHSSEREEEEILNEADKLLDMVIHSRREGIRVLKGQASVTRGNLRVKYILCCQFKGVNIKQHKKDTDDFFKIGFEMAPHDRYVLEEYGKHCRFRRKYEQAKCCLIAAISIYPTSKAYHHLGLIDFGEWKTSKKKRKVALDKYIDQMVPAREREMVRNEAYRLGGFSNFQYNTRFNKQKSDIARYIRADGLPLQDPNNQLLLQAKVHFEKSVELSGSENDVALQDLGFVLMNLGDYLTAHDVFKKIIRVENKEQPVLVNSYEQRGICLHHMSADDQITEEKRGSHIKNSKLMIMKAIELSSNLVVLNVPRQSYPLLHDMLRNEVLCEDLEKRAKSLKDLAKLAELVKKYGEAISILEEVRTINPDDRDAIAALARNYVKKGDCEEAIAYMDLLRCDRDFHTSFSNARDNLHDLYRDTNLQTGSQNLSRNDYDSSCGYYRKAYDFVFNSSKEVCRHDSRNFTYDVMVLSNSDESDAIFANIAADALKERFSLLCWTFAKDASPNMPVSEEYSEAIRASRHFLFILESDENSHPFDFWKNYVFQELSERKGILCKVVVLDSRENGQNPKEFQRYPVIKHRYDWASDSPETSGDEALNDILHKFVAQLVNHGSGH